MAEILYGPLFTCYYSAHKISEPIPLSFGGLLNFLKLLWVVYACALSRIYCPLPQPTILFWAEILWCYFYTCYWGSGKTVLWNSLWLVRYGDFYWKCSVVISVDALVKKNYFDSFASQLSFHLKFCVEAWLYVIIKSSKPVL